MAKKTKQILIICLLFVILIIYSLYYSFFIKPITKEEAGIIEYSSLLIIENKTNSKMYAVLNYNFSKEEIINIKKKNKYILANNYLSKDTIAIGALNDYSNIEIFKFSGIKDKPECLPTNFSLTLLDSLNQELKKWDKVEFKKDFKLNYDERIIKITKYDNNIVFE